MKAYLKLSIFVVGLLTSHLSSAAQPLVLSTFLNAARDQAQVSVKNASGDDVYCEAIAVKAAVSDSEFNDRVGEIQLRIENVYVKNGEEVTSGSLFLEELKSYQSSELQPMIQTVQSESIGCKPAGFVEYCHFAEKTAPEKWTLRVLQDETRRDRCEEIVKKIGVELSLEERQIESVRPLSFLTALKKLNLKHNNISDVSDLGHLTSLRTVDVSHNPVKSIDALVGLPVIERVRASRTDLEPQPFQLISRTLKRLCVDDTPFKSQLERTEYYKRLPTSFCWACP